MTVIKHKNKFTRHMETKEGFPIKVWLNRKTGGILPTNWKQQSSFLSKNTKVKREVAHG
jgi:hypothetical protein